MTTRKLSAYRAQDITSFTEDQRPTVGRKLIPIRDKSAITLVFPDNVMEVDLSTYASAAPAVEKMLYDLTLCGLVFHNTAYPNTWRITCKENTLLGTETNYDSFQGTKEAAIKRCRAMSDELKGEALRLEDPVFRLEVMLRTMDWDYHYSDDHRVARGWETRLREIEALSQKLVTEGRLTQEQVTALYTKYKPVN